MGERRFRRPAILTSEQADMLVGEEDPAARFELAQSTATALVGNGLDLSDEDKHLRKQIVSAIAKEGPDLVAELWDNTPESSLPGALWRLYLLKEWIRRFPEDLINEGIEIPAELQEILESLFAGNFSGDLQGLILAASGFISEVVVVRKQTAYWIAQDQHELAYRITRRANALLETAKELLQAANSAGEERL